MPLITKSFFAEPSFRGRKRIRSGSAPGATGGLSASASSAKKKTLADQPPVPRIELIDLARVSATSHVVIQLELVRMRPEADRIHFLRLLPLDPRLDQILGEDVTLQQEGVIGLEGF